MAKRTKKHSKSRLLNVEALEQRQLLATGFTAAQGQEFSDIQHVNGNVYDQVLLKTTSISVTNDPGQVTRVSFLDLQGDIVQAEFGGPGTLSISLDQSTLADADKGPQLATNYNQAGVNYIKGLASFTIEGSTASSSLNVFSVGSLTAVNKSLFDTTHTGGNNTADVQRVTIVANPTNPNGSTFGSLFLGNTIFTGSSGPVGITATNVQVQGNVTISDINATGTATPTLIFGGASQFGTVKVAGGDLVSENGKSINNNGSYLYSINLAEGTKSNGAVDTAENTYAQISFTGQDPIAAQTKTFTLTTGVDTITGTEANDVVIGQLTGDSTATFTGLDTINGGGGSDTLKINDLDTTANGNVLAGVSLTNVETVSLAALGAATIDSTGTTGVTSLIVTQGTVADVDAAKTTAITVSGITGAATIDGGSSVALTSAGAAVTIGGTVRPVGAITLTHSKVGANAVAIDGGTSVEVKATEVGTGTIVIGGPTAAEQPTGAVTVTSTGLAYVAGTSAAMGGVTIEGGTTVAVTLAPTTNNAAAATDAAPGTLTQSAVSITGTDVTTAVTVNQAAAVGTEAYVLGVAGKRETNVVTFSALTATQSTTINGLTFTAAKSLTAAEVATAFANISAGSNNGPAPASSGIYSGTLISGDHGFSSGAASSDTVTFTSTSDRNATDLDVDDGMVDPTVVKVDGNSKTDAKTGRAAIVGGMVTIADGGTGLDSLASVTLNGYGTGSTISSDALTSLSLSNAKDRTLVITNNTATTLALSVNKIEGGASAVVDDASGKYTTINITATGSDSDIGLDAVGAKTLTVDGSKKVTLTSGTLSVLETITVSGSAGVTTDADEADTLTAVNASGTSGSVTVQINPTLATFQGGSGNDSVTFVTGTTPTKAFNLGAGNDTLRLAAGTTSSSVELFGGDGTDTLRMNAADASTASGNATFEASITGFEKLRLDTAAGAATETVNLDNLDDINYVIHGGSDNAADVLNIDGMANAGTLEINSSLPVAPAAVPTPLYSTTDIDLKDSAGTTDSFNLLITNDGGINAGLVDVAGVETISITANDTKDAVNTHDLRLAANDLTTLNVTGSANVTLVLTSATDSLTLLNGSAMTGALTVTNNGVVTQETRGGSGADTLTAGFQSDVLIGNAGNDTLVVNGKSLVTMTGGAGNDVFNVSTATSNVNSYATITDLAAGDRIKFEGSATGFSATAITLDPSTAVFQDYANAAIAGSTDGAVMWFQYLGNTYVVQNVTGGSASSFTNNLDVIVKISGLVNLSTASFNSTPGDTLLIV